MDEFYLGYVFTGEELQVLFSGLDISGTFGLPIRLRELSADEEMQTIRQLLRKKILSWSESEGYRLDEKFRAAFISMKSSSHSLSLISRNYAVNGYVCFPGDPVVIWEISGYMEDRFTLLMFDWETFAEMLVSEEFIPRLSEYCEELPEETADEAEAAIRNAEADGVLSGLKYPFIVKRTSADSWEYLIVGSGIYGNYTVFISDDEKICAPYSTQSVLEYIRVHLNGEDKQ